MRTTLVTSLLVLSLGAQTGWARTACPPSRTDSSVPRGVSLVGQSGTPDPVGEATYVIRGFGGTPVPGAVVMLDFSACSDVRLATDTVVPGTLVNCTNHMVTGYTDATGTVTFRIVGSGTAGATRTLPDCLAAYADGVPLPSSIVSTFDLDGVNGVSALDGSILAADVFSGQYRARSDFDFDGRLTLLDLSSWARAFFGGGSLTSGVACGP